MKLAEALQERADLNRRIQQLNQRLDNNAMVQEGESPAEDPVQLLNELDGCVDNLERLIARINLTNCQTQVDGENLTSLLARRDTLKLRLGSYRNLTQSASKLGHRGMRSEIKWLSTVNVRELQIQVDQMARELRLLDNSIQAANWATELI